MKILVTGGAGFIGSHTIIELLNAGHEPIAYDNLCNASPVVFERIKAITGVDVPFIEGDIRDADKLREVFAEHDIDCVIHFAGLKAVGESVEKPIEYYDNNVGGTVKLLEAMRRCWLQEHHLLEFGHGIRHAASAAFDRGHAQGRSHQSLRAYQVHHRGHPRRRPACHPGHECRAAALLQSHRCASVRYHGRGPGRHPQ